MLTVMLGGGCLLWLSTAGPAAAGQSAGPARGVAVSAAVNGTHAPWLFYVGSAGQVWLRDLANPDGGPVNLGGRLLGGPAAVWVPPGSLFSAGAYAVFGRGTNNALYWRYQTASGWSPWMSLGGRLTSAPAVVAMKGTGKSTFVFVYARGADGALWTRTFHAARIWEPWVSDGGRLLAGTAPAAATRDGLFVAVTGTNRSIWVAVDLPGSPRVTWHSLGGQTTVQPGIVTPGVGTVVVFARGTNNAAYYNQFWVRAGLVKAGWQGLGGQITSGPSAVPTMGNVPQGPVYLFALGTNNQVYVRAGSWPALRGWTRAYA